MIQLRQNKITGKLISWFNDCKFKLNVAKMACIHVVGLLIFIGS